VESHKRTLVVIGASAGGVEALSRLVADLPPDLPAAVAIVLHVSPGASLLPAILDRRARLPVAAASDGEPLAPGRIYVAPPDHHLVVGDSAFHLTHGPKENGHRPAVDRLFSTAADALGHAVVGVILSGTLDDGSAGLAEIKLHGGAALVQDPADALYPSMPAHAIERVEVDRVVPLARMGEAICDLVMDRPSNPGASETPEDPRRPEPRGGELDAGPAMREGDALGLSCPECGGALWSVGHGAVQRFRCRIGHAYSDQALLEEQGKALEIAMWTALRALEERSAVLRRMASRAEAGGHSSSARRFRDHAGVLDERAAVIRDQVVPPAIEPEPDLAAEG